MKKLILLIIAICAAIYFYQFFPKQWESYQLEQQITLAENYGDGEAKKALKEISPARLRELAEQGNGFSQFQVGKVYLEQGNRLLAKEWFEKASQQNVPMAYRELAQFKTKENTRELIQKAADLGDNQAKFDLAKQALKNKDNLTYEMLIEQLAKVGYIKAEIALSDLYKGKRNYKKQIEWLQKAYTDLYKYHIDRLDDEYISVMTGLGHQYVLGIGAPEDREKAKSYFARINSELDIEIDSIVLLKDLFLKNYPELGDKLQALEDEVLNSKDGLRLLVLGYAILDDGNKSRAKFFFGEACDAGSQKGCDKYRELNEQGVK